MSNVHVEADIEGLGKILYCEGPFDKALSAIEKAGASIITAEELAYARMQAGSNHSLSKNGSYVREGSLFVPRAEHKVVIDMSRLMLSEKYHDSSCFTADLYDPSMLFSSMLFSNDEWKMLERMTGRVLPETLSKLRRAEIEKVQIRIPHPDYIREVAKESPIVLASRLDHYSKLCIKIYANAHYTGSQVRICVER